jgi:DNA-binding NtrC family response regulator
MKINIAIVDDEKNILELLKRFLSRQERYRVTTYENPLAVLSSLSADTDIVLLDIMMPQMNGLDLLPKLQEKHPELKVIMMTAYSTLDKVLSAHRDGAIHYLMKPFDSLEKLNTKIIEVIDK